MADGTLDAVIAADRLADSESRDDVELLHRRLTIFYTYFAVLGALTAIAGNVGRFPVGVDPDMLIRVTRVQTAHSAVIIAIFLILRRRPRPLPVLHALDLLGVAATAATAGFGVSILDFTLTIDVSVVAFFILFFVLRAALVPGKPWLVALVAALATIPFTWGLYGLYDHAQVPDPLEATFAAMRTMVAGVVASYVVSRTMYGLRRVAREAVQLGQYVVHEKIGEGGMGAVYRASHAMLRRPTAIKLIASERAGAAASARFEREVLAASRLSHPNNLAIYDFGRTRGGVFYYAMELLDGVDLARLVEREGPQPVARTLHILAQLADALAEAHEAGLVHRDVKPANIMLCTRGGVTDFVKVLDFGLVKDVSTDVKLTADTSVALGTPLYMAPEAIVAPESVGAPADVYAVGCIAYELLTGRPPFKARAVFEVCAAHVYQTPEPPSAHADGIPPEVDALVLRCLAKDPAQRPPTRTLANELRTLHHSQSGPSALPSSP